MSKVTVWSKPSCAQCNMAKALLKSRGIEYEEKLIGSNGLTADDLRAVAPSARSVPQIFVDNSLLGGYTELKAFLG